MTALVWDQVGEREYQAGIDRAVLYDPVGIGVAWNGFTGVDENNNNEVESMYFDGLKFNDIVTIGEYTGTLKAYTYPDEFLACEGSVEDQDGVVVTDQPPRRFHLSYRTRVFNDLDENHGYKIHLVYNLTANASTKTYTTLGLEGPAPIEFEWAISAIPEEIEGHRATAHLILDSTRLDPWLLADIEEIIYGNAERAPTMPSLKSLTTFIRKWNRLIITDNGDGTWTAESQDDSVIVMVSPTEFTIESDTADYINATTFTIESSEKNEEDV